MASGVRVGGKKTKLETVDYTERSERPDVGCDWIIEIHQETTVKKGKVTSSKPVFRIHQIIDSPSYMYDYGVKEIFRATVFGLPPFLETFNELVEEGRVGEMEIAGYVFQFTKDSVKFEYGGKEIELEKSAYTKCSLDELDKECEKLIEWAY
jgi:hypothetical protein